ncbi:MAG: hypothetical protein RIT13_556, partial [Pseudomonadota bacterium]
LLSTNVNNHTEKKANLTYLSWAWAWAEALKADPEAVYKVEMFEDEGGYKTCYMDVNGTAMVFVTVTMFGKPMTCQLPVMDFRNKAILAPDAFAVNTAIMRCMTKALALHGLGLYLYSGEDVPEGGATIKPTDGVIVDKNRENIIADVAIAVQDRFEASDLIGAYEEYLGIHDQEEKVALWALLPSNVRSALKKHGESLKGLKG